MPRLDGQASAFDDDVLPAKLIGNTEAIVRGGIHGVEGAMRSVGGILVAAGVVVLPEHARLPPHLGDSVSGSKRGSPGVDAVGSVMTVLADPLRGVVEALQCEAL